MSNKSLFDWNDWYHRCTFIQTRTLLHTHITFNNAETVCSAEALRPRQRGGWLVKQLAEVRSTSNALAVGALRMTGRTCASWRSRSARLSSPHPLEPGSRAGLTPLSDAALSDATLGAMVSALEARDSYTRNHSERVERYASLIATRLGLDTEQALHVRAAAVLHDIGKIGVPDSLLNKPGPLTDREYARVMEHPVIGERILRHLLYDGHPILRAVRSHHEWVDGSGRPDGLVGEEIPLAARLLAVADAFDAMTSARPYRAPLPPAIALAELEKNAGSQFDAQCVEALCEAYAASATSRSLAAVPA